MEREKYGLKKMKSRLSSDVAYTLTAVAIMVLIQVMS
jgi:hypothetical protein